MVVSVSGPSIVNAVLRVEGEHKELQELAPILLLLTGVKDALEK